MDLSPDDTQGLLDRVARGDHAAMPALLTRHRQRLRRMVQVHLDRRLVARVDPSDIVQEAITEASQRLEDYARRRPIAFYPWLRSLAWERLVKLHARHVQASKRSVLREQELLPEESVHELAQRLAPSDHSPSQVAVRRELRSRVHEALQQLALPYREVLVLRYLEELDVRSTAEVLALTEGAVKTRHYRALQRLHELLSSGEGGLR